MFPDFSLIRQFALAMSLMAALPAGLQAQELKLTPALGVKEEYNDNIFLTTDGKTGDFITTLSPSLELSSRTERRDAKLSGGINWLDYARHSSVNAVDYFVSGAFGYKLTPRRDFSAGAGYTRNSRPDQTDTATGLSVNSGSGLQSYQAGGTYVLTEKSKFSLSYGYTREDFDRPALLGSRQHQATGALSQALTPVLNLVESFSYNRQLTDVSRVDNYSATMGVIKQFSELWSLNLNAGGSYTHSDLNSQQQQTVSSGDLGWVGSLSFVYQGEKLSGSASFNHDVSMSAGRSGSTERTGGSINVGERLTDKLSASAGVGYYYNWSRQGQYSVQNIDETTLDVNCLLRYEFTRDMALEATYHYSNFDYSQSNVRANQNSIMLRFTVSHMYFL